MTKTVRRTSQYAWAFPSCGSIHTAQTQSRYLLDKAALIDNGGDTKYSNRNRFILSKMEQNNKSNRRSLHWPVPSCTHGERLRLLKVRKLYSPRESLYSGEATNLLLLLLSSGERDRDPRRGGERLRERDLNMSLSTAANNMAST